MYGDSQGSLLRARLSVGPVSGVVDQPGCPAVRGLGLFEDRPWVRFPLRVCLSLAWWRKESEPSLAS